jgi:hypothetical protein
LAGEYDAVTQETNLQVLKPSARKLRRGDVFALQPDDRFLFGRIITTDAAIGPMAKCILIYLFKVRSSSRAIPRRSELTPSKLLIPPTMTNRLPWTRGYFETLGNLPIEDGEMLAQHCFMSSTGEYYDEANRRLTRPVEPVGDWALHSYRTLDDSISDALCIPRVPA